MDRAQHAFAARALITACGGVEACVEICRLKKTKLYAAMDAAEPERPELEVAPPPTEQVGAEPTGYYLPVDVIDVLEAHCGEPIYAATLLAARPARTEHRGLVAEAAMLNGLTSVVVSIAGELHAGAPPAAASFEAVETTASDIEQAASRVRIAARARQL